MEINNQNKKNTREMRKEKLECVTYGGKQVIKLFQEVKKSVHNNTYLPLKRSIYDLEDYIKGWESLLKELEEIHEEPEDEPRSSHLQPGDGSGQTSPTCGSCESKEENRRAPTKETATWTGDDGNDFTIVPPKRPKNTKKRSAIVEQETDIPQAITTKKPTTKLYQREKSPPPKKKQGQRQQPQKREDLLPNPRQHKQQLQQRGQKLSPGREQENRKDLQQSQQPKQKMRPPRPRRSLAVLVQPATGKTYAETVKAVKSGLDPKKIGVTVSAIRKTKNGSVLVELASRHPEAAAKFAAAAVISGHQATALGQKTRLEVLGLDLTVDRDELKLELSQIKIEGLETGNVSVLHLIPDRRGTQTAIIEVSRGSGQKLISKGRLKIGWSDCRVRRRIELQRCYRCHCFGHPARRCTGPDRSTLCMVCGVSGHKAASCKAAPKCAYCDNKKDMNANHRTGSGVCPGFRKLMATAIAAKC